MQLRNYSFPLASMGMLINLCRKLYPVRVISFVSPSSQLFITSELTQYHSVDINMGCPEKNVCSSGHGSALIKEPELAQEIIQACKRAGVDTFHASVKPRARTNTRLNSH